MLPGGQTKCLLGIAHWNGILFLAPFAHLSLGTSAWQWSAWAIHLWRKLICPYFTRIFSLPIQFRLKPLSPRFSHSSFCSMFVPTLKDKLQQRYWISLHVWKHVATITQIPKHYVASRELNLTPADCGCNCTIIRAASCQAKLSFHYRFLPLSKWTLYMRHKYPFVFLYLPSFSTWEQVMQVTQMIEGWRQILWG